MPAGKTHEHINLFFLAIYFLSVFYVGFHSLSLALVFSGGFLFGTYLCGPDLDTRSDVYRRWRGLKFIWIPYRNFFPHRSFWTHGIIIGDIIRLLYLSAWSLPFLVMANELNEIDTFHWLSRTYQASRSEIWLFITGIISASTSHILSDVFFSYMRKR